MCGFLRTIGLIFAVAFVVAGVYVIQNFGETVEYDAWLRITTTTTNYIGIGSGVGLILQGLLTLFMTFTVAGTYENTEIIMKNLKAKNDEKVSEQEVTADNVDSPVEKQESENSKVSP